MSFASRPLTALVNTFLFGVVGSFPRIGCVFPEFRRIGRWSFPAVAMAFSRGEFTAPMALEGPMPPTPLYAG
eukprot:5245776-Pyramimonas_sp.AAC.1